MQKNQTMKSAIDGRRNPVHVSTLRLRRRLSAVMTAWYTRAMLAVSSSGGDFPPVSGEGECKFTKSYEKKYLKKRLFGILFGILL